MKRTLTKIKVMLSALWIVIISLPSKIIGLTTSMHRTPQMLYWVPETPDIEYFPPEPLTSAEWTPIIAIKIAQILLVAIIFIIWIVSFIKIKKIEDKNLKKKKIRNTIIIITILVLLLIAAFIIPTRLLTK